ncbi:hypothetical protein EXE53_25245 [Halorubrum sp. SD626R]|uniref:hypothetical protein n=1 Tax=Halorubrum sp. SD626R TaxID=1419722 RepID=UPI0010F7BB27|nr:hypothetical protein [Halorubrum sp. SD626R]TKX77693.1 hypothetical protein EXE53_25245 [Halorubrum sp. SD626R]
MSDIHTTHANNERGEQITWRTVTITDAAGEEFEHEFRELDNGDHEYLGEGEPPESAIEALEGYGDE